MSTFSMRVSSGISSVDSIRYDQNIFFFIKASFRISHSLPIIIAYNLHPVILNKDTLKIQKIHCKLYA
jgi:hypothetical protein